ncbi:MAG: MerR family transcriptional regulator [Nitrospirae bacterium YQR-1]
MLKVNQTVKPSAASSTDTLDIPQKLFYKIGEVSQITGLEPYVLRYWETEFVFLMPRKGKSGQRMYQKKDIELLLDIKRLLYDERFTIEGVRKKLAGRLVDEEAEQSDTCTRDVKDARATIELVKSRLRDVLKKLKKIGA